MTKRRDKAVDLVKSVIEVERQLLGLVLDLVPDEARKHLRASHKEKLLAVRALLDARIKRMEDTERRAKKAPQKVKVE